MLQDAARFAADEGKLSSQGTSLLPHYLPHLHDVRLWLDAIPDGDVAHVYFCYNNTQVTVPKQATPYPDDAHVLAMQNDNDARVPQGSQLHLVTRYPVKTGERHRWYWQHQVPASGPVVPVGPMERPINAQGVARRTLAPAERFANLTRNGRLAQASALVAESRAKAHEVQSLLKPEGNVARGAFECYEALGVQD